MDPPTSGFLASVEAAERSQEGVTIFSVEDLERKTIEVRPSSFLTEHFTTLELQNPSIHRLVC